MTDALADVFFTRDEETVLRVRQATVTSDSPVEVALGEATDIPASTCANYTPVVNDVVLVIQLGTDLIIIDAIVSGG